MDQDKQLPFMLETRLKELGARVTGTGGFSCHVVTSPEAHLVTGQNPNSARPCAQALITLAEGKNPAAITQAAESGDYATKQLPAVGAMKQAAVISGETLGAPTTTSRALDQFAMK